MKTIFKYVLVIITFTISIQIAKAGDTLNPCWIMVWPHDPKHGYYNPDSVLYDSCKCKDIRVYGCDSVYAKQWFEIIFNNKDPFNFPAFPDDTILETTWQNLDSSYVELRNIFNSLETIFGIFVFRKVYPEINDSNSLGSRGYIIRFQNYSNIRSVIKYLSNTNYFYNIRYQYRVIYIPDLIVEDNNYSFKIDINPNPVNDNLNITFIPNNYIYSTIYITDIFGKKFFEKYIQFEQNIEHKIIIDTEMLPTGIYFILIITEKQKFTKKFIISN